MAKKKVEEYPPCGLCGHCEYVMEPFNLLSLKGEPTLGKCPYVPNRCVLLSERGCRHFTIREGKAQGPTLPDQHGNAGYLQGSPNNLTA